MRNDGKIGIGTTTASDDLQIERTASANLSILSGMANTSSLLFGNTSQHGVSAIIHDNATQRLSFSTAGTADRLTINALGQVGIGNSIPTSELDVTGSLRLSGTSGVTRIMLGAVGGINSGYTGIYEKNAGDLALAVFSSTSTSTFGGNSKDALFIQKQTGFVGINTIAPSVALDVNGTAKVTDLQVVDGTQGANKVLASDAAGNASWVNSSINTGFSAYYSGTQAFPSSGANNVSFNNEDYDDGSNFTTVPSQYTAPSNGVYHFDSSVRLIGYPSVGQYVYIALYVNGSISKTSTGVSNTADFSLDISADLKLNAGDNVTVRLWLSSAIPGAVAGNSATCWFSGHRIY